MVDLARFSVDSRSNAKRSNKNISTGNNFRYYNGGMKITFDPTKDAKNCAKHGVSLALAAELEWDTALIWPDERWDYGEPRERALVLRGERLYFVAFVYRASFRRIISLRKATNQEQFRYVRDVCNDS